MNKRDFIHNLMKKKLNNLILHNETNRMENPGYIPHNHKDNRFRTLLLLLILLFSGIAMVLVKAEAKHKAELQTGIAREIIRFHVIANSDSDEDQALKLLVKNTLVEKLSPYLSNTDTIEEARTVLQDKLTYIKEMAENTIRANGFDYTVSVSLEEVFFPLRRYGDYTFPPGTYEALRVKIGEASGKNWWCVMFPPLCFVDETYSIIDAKTNEKLEYLLTEEEYEALFQKKTPIKIKFKVWESLKKLLKK